MTASGAGPARAQGVLAGPRSATRKDVAARAGVSPAVVSYVLNGGPRPVAAATKERVLEAVRDLGYRPHGLARSLKRGSARTIGVVVPDASNPFFAQLSSAVEAAAFERGYGVLVCATANDPVRERAYIAGLAERRIDGLVFVSTQEGTGLADLLGLDIPVVALDRLPGELPISTVAIRNELGALVGTQHLVSHGHRGIAFLGGPDATVTPARRRGWLEALERGRLRPAAEAEAPFTFEGGKRAAERIFGDRVARPTALLVCSDVQAIGALAALDRLGLRVPQDVALLAFDGTVIAEYTIPALTTVTQPIEQIARQAVAILLDRPRVAEHVVLDGALEIRRSCGCAVAQPASEPRGWRHGR